MSTRVLKVLMWKHGVVRLRKYINTLLDMLSPILFFIILFTLKDKINPPRRYDRPDLSFMSNTEVLRLTTDTTGPRTILYRPDTPLTNLLMDQVGEDLGIRRITKFPEKHTKGIYAYTKDSPIANFTSTMKSNDAIVIFKGMEGETWPTKLSYTIRMNHDYRVDGYEAEDTGPHAMFGIDYLKFMRLQWAIDSSFITAQSDSPINQTVSLQEFPFFRKPKNESARIFGGLITMLCWLSPLLTFVFLMSRLLEERTSGIQELIKMVGVSMNTLGLSHFLNVLPAGIIFAVTGATLLKISSNPILPNSNGFLIALFLLMFFITVIALACVCSYIIKTSEFAVTVAVIAYGLLWMPSYMLLKYTVPYWVKILCGILPFEPMHWFWKEVASFETHGEGVTFSTMFSSRTKHNGSVFLCYVFLLLQSFLYFGLAWYLSRVRPGKYGQALPWYFPCKKLFRGEGEKLSRDLDSDSVELMNRDELYFEKPPEHLKVGIRIEDVTKDYPHHRALKGVSLNVYQGEITVLVGHNGAGKTTLMSIITGMTSATTGKVYVNELDTVTQQEEVRHHIGLCPQYNMFFPDLTLQQHIMFFTMLKHGSFGEAKMSSRKLAARLGLEDKLQDMCGALSGGMKRRAQLACALAGDADVLVLDEPTAGLDVETRRELWDLLLSLRGERTVLLSTHFMEEADALGDRVAALHSGELRCFATTMHLKRAAGDGYRLSLTTIGLPKEAEITRVVQRRVPDATIKEMTMNSISFSLPAASNNRFPKLFSDLESRRSELGIDSIGVGVSTLEEVFLKLCSDVDTTILEEDIEDFEPEPTKYLLTGIPLYARQVIVLCKRQMRFAFYRKWIFLIMQIILPVTLIFLITKQSNNDTSVQRSGALKLDLDLYSDMPEKRALYDVQLEETLRSGSMERQYPDVVFEKVKNAAEAITRVAKEDVLEYNKYLVGVELNETDAKILYTTTVRHAAPVALNLLSNLLARRYLYPVARITTYNHPVEGFIRSDASSKTPKDFEFGITWAIFITFFIQSTILHCVSLPCRERLTGSRHIHIMSGCPAELYWCSTLLFHMALTALFLVLPTVVALLALEQDATLDQPDFIGAVTLILLVGSLALFAFMYLVSFMFNERYANLLLVACLFVFGLVFPLMKLSSDVFDQGKETDGKSLGVLDYILGTVWYISPPYVLVTTVLQCVKIARLNAWCILLRPDCPNIFALEFGWDDTVTARCCAGLSAKCYFCPDKSSVLSGFSILVAQFIFLMCMVMLTQRGLFNGLCDWLKNMRYNPKEEADSNRMVRAERVYVEREITKPVNDIKNDALLVSDIHKNYPSLCGSCNAVKGVSFSVKKGECFGLLGVNGAGKSTCFKMLTTEECTTKGRIYGNGYHLTRGNTEYLQTLGYCPQFFGLDMFLTGQQNLALLLTLRGFDRIEVEDQVQSWIDIVGLEKYARRRVEAYSGGCQRRLGAAAALCGGAPLTLLDEPSAGVDVAARRRLWLALRRALKQGRSIIITSHSMDEMETLCSRIAIMSAGRVRALGAAAQLRAEFASGHAVVFKVKHASAADGRFVSRCILLGSKICIRRHKTFIHSPENKEVDGSASSKLNTFKGKLNQKFNCSLKDEHKTMLHYHINETMHYSELFAKLEALRKEFPGLIEDYSVTETTLEEVFLSLAKEGKAEKETV